MPLGPEQNFIDEKPTVALELWAYPDSQGKASGALYQDDGESTDYVSGKFLRTDYTFGAGRLSERHSGNYAPTMPSPGLQVIGQ